MNVPQRTFQSNENVLFIREITRQLCHPTEGLPKDLDPPPSTLGEWKRCLNCLYGWVNVGIQKNVAGLFHSLKIGEVIPSGSPNMDIYNYGFATSEISRLLNTKSNNKTHRAIINYYSFLRMVKILMNSQSKEYCIKFSSSLKFIFTNLNPDDFWLNILVSKSTAEYLKLNEIGEIVVKEGSSGENNILEPSDKNPSPAIWSMEESDEEADNDSEDDNDGGDNEIEHKEKQDIMEDDLNRFSKMKVSEDVKEDVTKSINEDAKNDIIEIPYRLVMNNSTLLSLLTYACQLNGNIKNDVNVFQSMGGEDDEFTGLFGKLQI
jgi:hypothetical protein